MLTTLGIWFMRLLAHLPLAWIRGLGWLLGALLYALVRSRRRVALTNLRLCFPARSEAERRALAFDSFVYFAQAWLDRSWLWHGPRELLGRRLRMHGALQAFEGERPTIVFAPHFYGMDAGGMALAMAYQRRFTSIFTPQSDARLDDWIKAGRSRFGDVRMLSRNDGVKAIVSSLRGGGVLYLLPDMNFGAEESVFVPFYGVPAATVPSLSRFARLGRATIVPMTARLTPQGYDVEVHPPWTEFPSDDAVADTARMNRWLEGLIDTMPAQYYWVHKRFKTRPPGEPEVY